MVLNPWDVDIAHRVGRKQPGKNRPIITRFMTRIHKLEAIRRRKHLKGSDIVIREDLTYKNQKLLESTSRHQHVRNAWSREGKILAKLWSGAIIHVTSDTDIDQVVLETPKETKTDQKYPRRISSDHTTDIVPPMNISSPSILPTKL